MSEREEISFEKGEREEDAHGSTIAELAAS
jgi:hypothetical protein